MTSVCLVGKDCIAKEGLKGMLARAEMPVSAEYDDSSSLHLQQAPTPDSLIINIDTGVAEVDGDIIEAVRRQKTTYPQSRVVIVSSRRDVPAISAAFSTGADGYILRDISSDGLIGSLKLVMSGEKVFPTSILPSGTSVAPANTDAAPRRSPLSAREMGIIRHLAAGESNKAIAIALNIREATVKTHVKKILKKLGVANRTQAAVWAIANGYDKPLQ